MLGLPNLSDALTIPALSLEGVPETYVPGAAFTAQVGLPPIDDLGSYNVDLILSSSTGVAGVDYFFDAAATAPVASGYVFPSTSNYLDAVNVDSPSQHRITLSDFLSTGTDIVAGVNDEIALLTIQTSNSFAGVLELSFDVDGLILDTPAASPTPVANFSSIAAATAAQNPYTIRRIPEPASVALLAFAAITAFGRRRVSIARRK